MPTYDIPGDLVPQRIDGLESFSMLPVGTIFASAVPQTDARVHLLDGSTILQTGVYETFANLIKALVSAGNNISCTQSQFDSDVSVYGQCGKFVIDDTAGTIRLPLITEFIASNNGGQNIGLAQLDDFKRHNHGITVASDGSIVSYNMTLSSSGVNTTYRFSSTGNVGNRNGADGSHYTGGSETRPKNVRYPYYIVLAAGYKSDQVVDIDNIVTELNSKQAEIVTGNGLSFNGNILNADVKKDDLASVGFVYNTTSTSVLSATNGQKTLITHSAYLKKGKYLAYMWAPIKTGSYTGDLDLLVDGWNVYFQAATNLTGQFVGVNGGGTFVVNEDKTYNFELLIYSRATVTLQSYSTYGFLIMRVGD